MAMALTCHQLGLKAQVFEAVSEIKPLGVGINLQPNAVRELIDLELEGLLADIGIQAEEWALFTKSGELVWAEPRGLNAGYHWPQYSVHRGYLLMGLLAAVKNRLGSDAVVTDARLTGYKNIENGVAAEFTSLDGSTHWVNGDLLIGADGIHSQVRKQMHPNQGQPNWGGAVMWRGISEGLPTRTQNSFVLMGSMEQRFVCYPISKPDPKTGLSRINWIAELTLPTHESATQSDWNSAAEIEDFISPFNHWQFDWLDVPALIKSADAVYEYPMVDRDPVDHWVEGPVVLIGDAAHAMYPVGSNGASQGIVDARELGAKLKALGLTTDALLAYQSSVLPAVNELVLRNRGAGPIGILGVIEARGPFQSIDEVISTDEIREFMSAYKEAAGFALSTLNTSPKTIED